MNKILTLGIHECPKSGHLESGIQQKARPLFHLKRSSCRVWHFDFGMSQNPLFVDWHAIYNHDVFIG